MKNDKEMPVDDMLMDRLVDGELSEAEYREALSRLESESDGWRRCALAFLEAQAWGNDFRAVRCEDTSPATTAAPAPRASWFYLGTFCLGCAASFLLAFGVALQILEPPSSVPGDPQLVSEEVAPNRAPGRGDPLPGNLEMLANSGGTPIDPAAVDGHESMQPIGRYQLVVDGGAGTPQSVEMPVLAAHDPRVGLLLDEQGSVPSEVIEMLRREGNEVERRRSWLPLQSQSGAPLYVPVDELHVTPVSSRHFQ